MVDCVLWFDETLLEISNKLLGPTLRQFIRAQIAETAVKTRTHASTDKQTASQRTAPWHDKAYLDKDILILQLQ